MTNQLSFDGHGINGPDEYRSRIATFSSSEDARKYGALFEHSQGLLEALEKLLYIHIHDMGHHQDIEDDFHDRELLAQWLISRGFSTGHGDSVYDLIAELNWQIDQERTYTNKLREALTHIRDFNPTNTGLIGDQFYAKLVAKNALMEEKS